MSNNTININDYRKNIGTAGNFSFLIITEEPTFKDRNVNKAEFQGEFIGSYKNEFEMVKIKDYLITLISTVDANGISTDPFLNKVKVDNDYVLTYTYQSITSNKSSSILILRIYTRSPTELQNIQNSTTSPL